MAFLGGRRGLGVLMLALVAVALLRDHRTSGSIAPVLPQALAIAINGNLLIADRGRNEVLERAPDGSYVVGVGSGAAGDRGDGSSALQARIDAPTSMAVGGGGALYFAQAGGAGSAPTVVREVAPDGAISTVVGAHPDCGAAARSARTIPAEDAELVAPALAVASDGRLLLAGRDCPGTLDGGPLLELTARGSLVDAAAAAPVAAAGCDPAALAASPAGTLAIACAGRAPKVLLLSAAGTLRRTLRGVRVSALAADPDGAFVAVSATALLRLSRVGAATRLVALGPGSSAARELGSSAPPAGVAVARDGDIELSFSPRRGHSGVAGLVEVGAHGRLHVLWRG